MTTPRSEFNNYGRFAIEGMVDLSAAGAVVATRGDNMTTVKNGTGLYEVTIKNPSGFILNEKLGMGVALVDAAIGTVKDVGVKSFAQQTDGSFLMILRTVAATGADVDEATDALSVAFSAVLRVRAMAQTI